MARAHPVTEQHPSLYERDFYLWIEQQAVSCARRLERLDVTNLVEEIEDGPETRRPSRAISSSCSSIC